MYRVSIEDFSSLTALETSIPTRRTYWRIVSCKQPARFVDSSQVKQRQVMAAVPVVPLWDDLYLPRRYDHTVAALEGQRVRMLMDGGDLPADVALYILHRETLQLTRRVSASAYSLNPRAFVAVFKTENRSDQPVSMALRYLTTPDARGNKEAFGQCIACMAYIHDAAASEKQEEEEEEEEEVSEEEGFDDEEDEEFSRKRPRLPPPAALVPAAAAASSGLAADRRVRLAALTQERSPWRPADARARHNVQFKCKWVYAATVASGVGGFIELVGSNISVVHELTAAVVHDSAVHAWRDGLEQVATRLNRDSRLPDSLVGPTRRWEPVYFRCGFANCYYAPVFTLRRHDEAGGLRDADMQPVEELAADTLPVGIAAARADPGIIGSVRSISNQSRSEAASYVLLRNADDYVGGDGRELVSVHPSLRGGALELRFTGTRMILTRG